MKTRQEFCAHLTENKLHVNNRLRIRHLCIILFMEIIGVYCKITQGKDVCMRALKADRGIGAAECSA